jgi:hypothetical protein
LHEEFHALYNGIGPYAPLDATGMDVDDDEDEHAVAPTDDMTSLVMVEMVTSLTPTMAPRSRLVALR